MKSSKVLEMLNLNRIEELKSELRDEIFTESLKNKPNVKKRYAAMKRYLKTCSETREILTKPCEVDFDGTKYNAFCNSYSLALTTESCGEIEMCSEPDRYPDVGRLVKFEGEKFKIDFNKVLAEAKSKGYKFTKNAIHSNYYLMKFKGSYFRMALVDITYSILDEGEEIDVWFNGKLRPITIQNNLGVGIILPIRRESEAGTDEVIVNID
jgi:hypothetical protein